jgi:hypothetical protein
MGEAVAVAAEAVVPLELFFGVDRQQRTLAEAFCKTCIDRPSRRVEKVGV